MSSEQPVNIRVCPECGRAVEENWNTCPNCSKQLKKSSFIRISIGNLSIVFAVVAFFIFGIPFGIAAIVSGTYALIHGDKRAIIGIVLGSVAFAFGVWIVFSS